MTNALALYGLGCGTPFAGNPMYESIFSDGLSGSIFGPNAFNGSVMFNPMYDGFMSNPISMYGGMGFMPSFGAGLMPSDYRKIANMSPDERMQYMSELEEKQYEYANRRSEIMEDRQYERNLKRVQRQNGIQSAERAARDAAVKLNNLITMNRKDEIIGCFGELKRQIANLPQCKKLVKGPDGKHVAVEIDDKELSAYAREYYAQVTGKDLIAQINNELSGSFSQGLKTGLTFGLCGDKQDADSLTESILGLKRDGTNAIARGTGRTLSGAGVGAAVGTFFCPGAGTLIGGGIGALVGLVSSWF